LLVAVASGRTRITLARSAIDRSIDRSKKCTAAAEE
jgi:hypothetical protein